ncbi:MAG TPA: hypothetical protein VEH77_15775, partial [Roseiarcus sp.]|nr:hypothetical protein [Roseiarcus sp.]
RLVLWDTDGDFGSRIFETVYLAGASGAIVVADASRPSTIAKAARLAEGFEKHFPGRSLSRLVNKIDLLPEHFRLSEEDDLTYVSARSGAGVDAAFLALATTLWRRRR